MRQLTVVYKSFRKASRRNSRRSMLIQSKVLCICSASQESHVSIKKEAETNAYEMFLSKKIG